MKKNSIRYNIVYYDTSVRGKRLTHKFGSRAHTCIVFYFSKRVPRGSTKYVWCILFFKANAAKLDEIREYSFYFK